MPPPTYLVIVVRYMSIFSVLQNEYSITSVLFSINKYILRHNNLYPNMSSTPLDPTYPPSTKNRVGKPTKGSGDQSFS